MFKSKIGWFLVGAYLLIVLFGVFEFVRTPPEPMKEFALLILTLPGSFLLSVALESTGFVDDRTGPSWFLVLVLLGAIANLTILYFLGYGCSKILQLLRERK